MRTSTVLCRESLFYSGICIVLKHWIAESQWAERKMTYPSLKSLFPCIEWLLMCRDRVRKDGHDKEVSLRKTGQTAKHDAQETETSLQQVGINGFFPFSSFFSHFISFFLFFFLLSFFSLLSSSLPSVCFSILISRKRNLNKTRIIWDFRLNFPNTSGLEVE